MSVNTTFRTVNLVRPQEMECQTHGNAGFKYILDEGLLVEACTEVEWLCLLILEAWLGVGS